MSRSRPLFAAQVCSGEWLDSGGGVGGRAAPSLVVEDITGTDVRTTDRVENRPGTEGVVADGDAIRHGWTVREDEVGGALTQQQAAWRRVGGETGDYGVAMSEGNRRVAALENSPAGGKGDIAVR